MAEHKGMATSTNKGTILNETPECPNLPLCGWKRDSNYDFLVENFIKDGRGFAEPLR